MKLLTKLTLLLLLVACLPDFAAAKQRIKLTTLAPKGSSFHKSLQRMSSDWRKISGGQINIIIYPGGIQGGESAMVERMAINQTHAGLLSGTGLAEIEPSVKGLQIMPMMFNDLEEYDYVSEKIEPKLERMIRAKGFIVLFWTDVGFVRFFAKEPVLTPDDLKKLKLFTWSGDPKQASVMKSAGFNIVPLETADILTSLQTGLIEAVPMPPFYALSGQVFGPAPHMLDLNWAPLIGAAVITEKSWNRIPDEFKDAFLESAKKTGIAIKAAGRRESYLAIKTMHEKWNLQVHPVDQKIVEEWRNMCRQIYPDLRGKIIPEDIFDEVESLVKEYRALP
ncbi:MAG: TRAP transporter substrate-binding protein DctP [Opitutaceae bacterium]|nr:TRAP transporter substrate-binding protein DctP [Opitutaceae bacterium]